MGEIDRIKQVMVDGEHTDGDLEWCVDRIVELERGIKDGLWWAEQHTDSAVGRRLRDYRKTIEAIRNALLGKEKNDE